MSRRLLVFLSLTAALAARTVDHGFSPPTWHSALGLPDDWHKPLADERGALLYDFGPGPYAIPLTTVEFGLREQPTTLVRQWLPTPTVPEIHTTLAAGTAPIDVTTFAVPPETIAESNG